MYAKPILLVPLLCLAACSTPSASVKPVLASIPHSLKMDCKAPTAIPDGDLSYDEAIVIWAKDRSSLDECGIRHKALADATNALEGN